MCGIFGIYNLNSQAVDLQLVEKATSSMRHRGPDDEGYLLVNSERHNKYSCGGRNTDARLDLPDISTFKEDVFDVALGFRRLSIIDLSPGGHQPMPSHDGRYWTIFNGEIYNYLELRSILSAHGYTFNSETDTEVILAAYQRWGSDCLKHFNGMWSFAIWDDVEQSLFISRDPFGIKPLYYHYHADQFIFASEIKAIVGWQGIPFQANNEVIHRYLVTGLMPNQLQGATFFNNIHSLQPGHWMKINRSGLVIERYWHLPVPESVYPSSLEDSIEAFNALFDDSVLIRLRSDVKVGSCLSGGIDSSAIVATIHKIMSKNGFSSEQIGDIQQTFSAVYQSDGPYNESKYVNLLLNNIPIKKNLTIPDLDKFRTVVEKMVWHQEEPFPSTSIFAQWCVMEKARQEGITVLLDGQGADELMGGYRPYSKYFADLIKKRNFRFLISEVKALLDIDGLVAWRYLAIAFAYAAPQMKFMNQRLQMQFNSNYDVINPDFNRLYRHDTDISGYPTDSLDQHLRMIFEDTNLPNLLRYEDKNSMAFGIEARVPFLDNRLVEMLFGSAANWRIKNGWTKYIMRLAMRNRLPDEITWRKDKVGFGTPEKQWLLEWMSKTHLDILCNNSSIEDYIDIKQTQRHIHYWIQFRGKMPPIWRWINLAIWLAQWKSIH